MAVVSVANWCFSVLNAPVKLHSSVSYPCCFVAASSHKSNLKRKSPRSHSRSSSPQSNPENPGRVRDESSSSELLQTMAFKAFGSPKKEKKEALSDFRDQQQTDPGKIHDASFLNAVVKVYCTHTAPDYSLPWQKQRQFTSTGSAFMIGDGKLLTN